MLLAWMRLSGGSSEYSSGGSTGFFAIRAESIRADKEAKLDREKRQDDRRLGSDNFQRETLLRLQEDLAVFMRAEGRGHHADVMALREFGGLRQYPPAISEEMFAARRQLGYTVERVKDDELRAAVQRLTRRVSEMQAARLVLHEGVTEAQLDADMLEMAELGDVANQRLGVVLRGLL